jgi:hypothetical protein
MSQPSLWQNQTRLVVAVSIALIANFGCSNSKPEPAVVVSPDPAGPETADAAVLSVFTGLQVENLLPMWDFLPPSYRGDLEQLVHEFGGRLDDTSWEPFVATCRKAHAVASQLARRFDHRVESPTESDRQWTSALHQTAQFLKVLCESELSAPAKLQQLDLPRFLGHTGHELLAAWSPREFGRPTGQSDLFSQLAAVRVELSSSSGDSAVVSVTWPGQEPTLHKFVLVEQHWIPRTLSESWPVEFPKVRAQVLNWAEGLRANPEPWHARLRDVDQWLDELAKTQSPEEARRVGQAGLSRLLVSWLGLTVPESPKSAQLPVESRPSETPKRIKRPDTEVLLPDDPEQK